MTTIGDEISSNRDGLDRLIKLSEHKELPYPDEFWNPVRAAADKLHEAAKVLDE